MTPEEQQEQLSPEQIAEQEERDFLAAANGEDVEQASTSDPEQNAEPAANSNEGAEPNAADAGDADAHDQGDKEFDLSSLPQSTIDKLEEKLTTRIEERLSGRLRNIEGHIGGLKHNLSQLSTAAKAAEKQGADAPTTSQMRDAMQSGAKLNALKEEFPEWAEAIEESMQSVASRIPQVDMEGINQRFQTTEQTAAQLMNRARQMARLDMAHPDWEQTIATDQFQNWLMNQSPETQALADSENATDAIKALDSFSEFVKASEPDLTAQRRQKNTRLESAVTPTSGGQASRRQPTTEHEEFIAAFGG